ncbi:MAG: response regulator [Chloroflexi bacterium]|nr:response regulator [Chloroflexota bacterium]
MITMQKEVRILVVDDDPTITDTLADIFNLKGFFVSVANSGLNALEQFKHGHFNIMLTDIRMPEMDGVDLFRAIQEIQPGFPVILMTAYASAEEIKEVMQEGALVTIIKPLDIDNLIAHILSNI